MLRFALKAIVAGISGVIAFGVALWASMIPPLIAATAAVTAFTVALLANPVVLVIIAIIGAFVALGFVVYKFRRQILGALKAVWKWVKGNWPLLVGILLGPFGDRRGADMEVPGPDTRCFPRRVGLAQGIAHLWPGHRRDSGHH